jgi:hypothetical protein
MSEQNILRGIITDDVTHAIDGSGCPSEDRFRVLSPVCGMVMIGKRRRAAGIVIRTLIKKWIATIAENLSQTTERSCLKSPLYLLSFWECVETIRRGSICAGWGKGGVSDE